MYRKILFINPFGIGDVLFTTPVIHSLKERFPQTEISYLCNRRSYAVLKNNPYLAKFFIYERDEFVSFGRQSYLAWLKKYLDFLNQLKNEHFDLALDFSLNTQYGFFSWYAGIRRRVGYDYKNRGGFLTQKIRLTGYSQRHVIEYYADLINLLGCQAKYKKPELYLEQKDSRKIEELIASRGLDPGRILVGVIPGGGRSWGEQASFKHWPAEKFALLADKIVENYSAQIIIMGDFSEKEIASRVASRMRNPAVNLCAETTLGELAALLSKMRLVVTNDGGPLHMAAALGVKTLSIFGPVDPLVYGPYPADPSRHVVFRKSLSCSPCYNNFRLSNCLRNRECINTIEVEEASTALRSLLN